MPDGIFGKKLGMTRIFDDDGTVVPVTVIEAGPCFVVQKKTSAKDGYEALQVGFERRPLAKVNKPEAGHLEKHGSKSGFTLLREIRVENAEGFEPGQELTVEQFAIGDRLMVTGTSRGRGFTGTVKRWGFHVGPRTHGSMSHRAPGSIGASADPARVFKGTKMGGQMGDVRKTIQNLQIWQVRPDRNVLLLKGSIPGSKNGYVIIRQARKKSA